MNDVLEAGVYQESAVSAVRHDPLSSGSSSDASCGFHAPGTS